MSNAVDINNNYNNTHRAFLQALLARQSITFAEAQPILAAIQTAATPERPTLAEDVTREDFEAYIHTLNAHISAFDLEIRGTRHQASREAIWALVNTTSDALTQMATLHSADEIAFVKRVLDAMFDRFNTVQAEVMAVTSQQALQCAKVAAGDRRNSRGTQTASATSGLTLAQAETVLDSLVAEGWFERSAAGYYSLTPRALMELRGWLMDTYNYAPAGDEDEDEEVHVKIKFCQACKDIVTVGQRCPNEACLARIHNHCVRTLFRAQGGEEKCPLCKSRWSDPAPVGETASRSGSRRSTGANGQRERQNRSATSGTDNVDYDSDQSSV